MCATGNMKGSVMCRKKPVKCWLMLGRAKRVMADTR